LAFVEKQPSPDVLKPHLERSVSLAEAVVYGLGIILGAGIYTLIGEAAGTAGNSVWISFVAAAAIASFTALSYCELSSIFPKSAAEYAYVKNAFRSNILGFMMGWISLFAAMVSISAVSLGFAGYFVELVNVPIPLVAVSVIALLSIVNFLGIRESARLNIVLTVIAVVGLVLVVIMGLPFLGSVDYFASVEPKLPLGSYLNNIAVAAALIFFAYIGFEDIANISEETMNATKAVPKAIILALAISTVLYVLVSISAISIVPWQALSQTSAPISLVAGAVLGPLGAIVFAVIALFATASTVLIILVAVSRLLYGISADHSLPEFISRVHSKTKTPFVSIALTSVVAMLFVLAGGLKDVAFITNFGIFTMFAMVNLSVIVLRFTSPAKKRPFRLRGSIGRIPVVSILGFLSSLFMLSRIEPASALVAAGFILLGIPLYLLLTRLK
jgi:APA family basic amino acid/polyamine antiporter